MRAEKARIYRFDGAVRQFNYYRFLPSFVNGQHGFDLNQQVSDFNLKLLPQRAARIDLGYTRSRASGPLTTTYIYDFDDFQIKGEERWEANDYRLGLETSYRRWNFLLGGMYRAYKSDWRYFQDAGVNRGNNPNDRVTLNSFDRFTADRAKAALARWGLSGAPTPKLHLAARGHYTDERLEGALRESNSGVNNLNVPILAQSVSADGEAKRSSATSDVALTYDLTEHISVSNTFDYNALRIPGHAQALIQTRTLPPGGNEQTTTAPTFNSRLTDLTSYWNTLQVNLNLGAKFSANLGWRATRRDIRLDILPNRQTRTTNNTQAFIGGARFRPVKPVSLFFDYERGTLDTAFVRLNPLEIQRTRVRANLKLAERFSLNSTFSATDSANPTPQVNNEADFRAFSLSANWERGARLWLNGGYNYDTLSSVADLFFFSRFAPQRGRSATAITAITKKTLARRIIARASSRPVCVSPSNRKERKIMTAKRTIVATLSSAVLILYLWSPVPLQAGQTQDEEIKKLYALNCAACHASDGSGDTAVGKQLKASDLRSEKVQKESDRELYDFIAKGKKKMPGFEKKLGKDQISRLVTYLRTLAEDR